VAFIGAADTAAAIPQAAPLARMPLGLDEFESLLVFLVVGLQRLIIGVLLAIVLRLRG